MYIQFIQDFNCSTVRHILYFYTSQLSH